MIRGLMMAAASRSTSGGGVTDPHWADVKLLMHFDGSFADSGPAGRTAIVTGSPSATDSTSRFGTSGYFGGADVLEFDGVGTALDIPSTGDWTLEMSVRFSEIRTSILYQHAIGTGLYPLQVRLNSDGKLQALGFDSSPTLAYSITSSTVASLNTWYVLGVRRSGSSISFWVDGVEIGSTSFSGGLFGSSLPVVVGAYSTTAYGLIGRIDELRLTVGVARDMSVIPTAPF